MTAHRFKPETTNAGNCFADCACGWLGGVHRSRSLAKAAWQNHIDGGLRIQPITTTVVFGERARGM